MDSHHAQPDPAADEDAPDLDLINRVRAGDLEAFDPLYRRHRNAALRHARHWTRSEAAAEDLSAESFTRVLYAIRNGGFSGAIMPENIVVGEDAKAVAAFVAKYSGGGADKTAQSGTSPGD